MFCFCRTVFLTQCVSLFVDEPAVMSLLLHNLTFSCPRSQDNNPVRDFITHEIKVYAYNNNNNNNNNAEFPSQFCLGSISNKFGAIDSREVSLKGNVFDFGVGYNVANKSDILNIHQYLMVKNNI